MSLSKIATEQRKREVASLKRFMRFGIPGAIAINLLAALLIGASWQNSPTVAKPEDEIEIIVEDQPDTEAPIAQVDQDAGGSGSSQVSLFNPNPGSVANDSVEIPVASDPIVAQSPEPIPTPEPEVPDPVPTPAPTPIPAPTPDPSPISTPEPTTSPSPNPSPSASPAAAASPSPDPASSPIAADSANSPNSSSQAQNGNAGQSNPRTSLGSGNGQGNGIGNLGSGNEVGNGQGTGTGSGLGNEPQGKKPIEPAKPAEPVAVREAPPRENSDPPRSSRKRPKCKNNCEIDGYLGAEGSSRFDFDVDRNGNVINVRLRQPSGNSEIDRKAEEAIRRRKYEASESGFQGQRIRVTSEQDGSEFQRQNRDRRREEAAQQEQQQREEAARAEQKRPPASAVEPKKPVEPAKPTEPVPASPTPEAKPIPAEPPVFPAKPAPVEPVPAEPAPVETTPASP